MVLFQKTNLLIPWLKLQSKNCSDTVHVKMQVCCTTLLGQRLETADSDVDFGVVSDQTWANVTCNSRCVTDNNNRRRAADEHSMLSV